jgi:hypothetical protein
MRFDRNSIMAPIGRPSPVMGVRPILREPGLGMPERSIFEQPNPFLPPQTPITPPVNITGPVLPRMKPPVIPPRPPSIGGVGGINQNFRPLERPVIPQISEQPIVPIRPLVSTPLQARRQELENLGYDAADVQEILERDQVRGLGNVTSNVLPSIPIAPPPINIGGPALDTSLIPQREILERPIIPPRRDDFMSIERIGNTDDMARLPEPPLQATPAPVLPPVVTPDPIIEPAPTTPAAVAPTAGAVPTQTQMPMGAIDPVLLQQQTSEKLTDPLIRSLYFGTQDSPGFFQQLQQAGQILLVVMYLYNKQQVYLH